VPPVASEASTPAFPPPLPNSARPTPSSGRTSDQPFEALLNDDPQAASDPPPPASPPPRSDRTQPATQADQSPPPAKTADANAPKTNDATPSADAGTTDKICKRDGLVEAVFKAAADKPATKTASQTDATDDPKPATVNKATDSLITADATATVSNPTAIPAAATVVAAIAAVVAPATTLHAAITVAENPQTTSGGDTTVPVKTATAPQTGSKAQQAAGDADKPAAPLMHGEAADTSRHIATAETPPAIIADAQPAAPKVAADAMQPAALSGPAQNVAPTAANPAAPAPQAPQALAVPLAGVAIEIAGKAFAGKNRFEIRLDPPELGRVEVRLDVDRDGNTTTRLIADRADTLDLLRRDSTGLERALQDAGLKTADNSLQFSLRDQTMGRDPNNTPTPGAAQIVVQDDLLAVADLAPRHYSRLAGLGGGIDIRV
jgi:flagellar hook-length control protein FliK